MIVQQLKLEAHKVVTIEPSAKLKELLETLNHSGFQHIPVVADGIYYGMAGHPELHKAFFESGQDRTAFLEEATVDQITVNRDAIISEAGNIEGILKNIDRVPFLAVLDADSRFNGIVTRTALFDMLRSSLGMHQAGIRLSVSMPEMQGILERFGNVVRKHSNIFGLLVLDDNTNFGYRRVSFKVAPGTNIEALTEDLRKIGVRVFHVAP